MQCFRPLTGKLVLIAVNHPKYYQGKIEVFPSPYGEVGFDLEMFAKLKKILFMFPSPYGEVGFNRLSGATT